MHGTARDIGHEVAMAAALSELVRSGKVRALPPVVQSAVHTAFATHMRSLLEFFHDGPPSSADWSKLPAEPRQTVHYSWITETRPNPFAGRWTKRDLARCRDAHKLMGHLAEERQRRRRMRREWG